MEEIIAIKVEDGKRGRTAFLTWGRSFDPVDPEPLLEAVAKGLKRFGITKVKRIEVCGTLQEVKGFPYFFESLSLMTMKGIPFGKSSYGLWRTKMQGGIAQGREMYCLGFLKKGKRASTV